MSRIAVLVVSLSVLSSWGVRGQTPEGDLAGFVQDSSGGRVPDAKIRLLAFESPFVRVAISSDRGEFRVDYLRPGAYHMTVNAPGFAETGSDVRVVTSTVREVVVTLAPASAHQSVDVRGEAPSITTEPIDATSAVHEGAVTSQDLATTPLAHRSFANVAYLVPGTEPVEPSDPTKARITAVSFGGSSGLNDQLSVDGGDNSDDFIGGFLQNFSPDAIQEFAVQTSQQNADTGRTTGGSVVITTKGGTNQFREDLSFYERAAALNARYPIDNPAPDPKQPFSRQNYVGTIGGPLRKEKLWFFSSLEYVRENASIAYSPATQTQFSALASLASQGLIPSVGSIPLSNNVPVPFNDYLTAARLDWLQSSRSRWFVRAAGDTYLTRNDLVQEATLPSTGATSHSNFLNVVLNQQFIFSPTWLGSLTLMASLLHHTEERNSQLGFALAFPFSATSRTISGFETLGDNQFVTPITAFPVLRNQQKYQFRYDVNHSSGRHAPRFGVDFIHEPVLSGALSGTAENLTIFSLDPTAYLANPHQFSVDLVCGEAATDGTDCMKTPASNGSFSQNVQRLGFYAEDSWRVTPRLTVNYGVRYDTTFGLFVASSRSQKVNPALLTLQSLQIPLVSGEPHDYRAALAPRLGIGYSLGHGDRTVIRAGFGIYYSDLAQFGWVSALRAVNVPSAPCVNLGDSGCLPGAAFGGAGAIVDPQYKTPYALHASAGVAHAFNSKWTLSADWTHEQGVHSYARYQYTAGHNLFSPLFPRSDVTDQLNNVPDVSVFRSDNRSRYDGMSVRLQGNVSHRMNLVVNYTWSSARTWGCILGEVLDYVNGVCNPLHAFGKGDFGPSGEDVVGRLVVAGVFHAPVGFELSLLGQAEGARPLTLATPVDVNGTGDPTDDRAVINGAQTRLDQFRGTPYIQFDMRVARPIQVGERWLVSPFIDLFNILNRNNPGANYVTDISALPIPVNDLSNATALCPTPACSVPIRSANQLLVPSGALGDFFGPGTTVGIPFAAQIGIRATF